MTEPAAPAAPAVPPGSGGPAATDLPSHDLVIARTRAWVRGAVVGLNLCPFARAVEGKGQIRYVVSDATDEQALLATLCVELQRLADTEPSQVETTLLMHPGVLNDFEDFNDFLDIADAAVEELELEGVLQVASFHPDFQFADTAPSDVTNATNRAPYPTLHLLREESVDRAVAAFPEAEAIFETNMATLERLGADGWARVQAECEAQARTELASVGFDAGPAPGEDEDAGTPTPPSPQPPAPAPVPTRHPSADGSDGSHSH